MKRRIAKKVDAFLTLVLIVVLLPYFVTIIFQRMRLEEVVYGELAADGGEAVGTELPGEGWEETGDALEELIPGIVAREIHVGGEREAILAQCVIARTNLCDARERGLEEEVPLTEEEMRGLWGEHFEEAYREVVSCTAETEHQVLVWNGDFIYAAYHALSAGRTRNITALYPDAQMPYLVERMCQGDVTAEGYLDVTYLTEEEFLQKCREAVPDAAIETAADVTVGSRDQAGYVKEVLIGGQECTGEEFRNRLGLNSACFSIAETDRGVRIVTKRLGHGFGLSQNMAQCMARDGRSYEEILAYFYPGAELVTNSSLK